MLPESEIGKTIRKFRTSVGLTLDELAEKTGFTKGYLSKVENSPKAPPVSTLINISGALGTTISQIVGEGLESVTASLVRKDERHTMARGGSEFGYAYETLAHKFANKTMDPYILTIPPGIEEHPLFQHKGEEIFMVMSGRVKFFHDGNEYMIEEGDCFYFDSTLPHRGFAQDGREAKCLIVIYTP